MATAAPLYCCAAAVRPSPQLALAESQNLPQIEQATTGAPAMKSVAAAAGATSYSTPVRGLETTASEVAKPVIKPVVVLASPAWSATQENERGRRSNRTGGGHVPSSAVRIINLANDDNADDDDAAADSVTRTDSEVATANSENAAISENAVYSENAACSEATVDSEPVDDSENIANSENAVDSENAPSWESAVHLDNAADSENADDSVVVVDSESVADSEAVVNSEFAGDSGAADSEADSLALARMLMEEEAMASYSAAVDILRGTEGGFDGIEGVAEEDMAAMQALLEEDERSPRTFAMAEDESLDYDGMLELGSAIGDVRKERWRLRCKSVIAALPRVSYTAGGASDGGSGEGEGDTKCLVCQCEFEDSEELTRLPCGHSFHTECVDGWLQENEECPTCRRSISPS